MRVVRCVVSWQPGISTGGLLALMIALLAIACNAGSNSDDRPTPTPTASATATAPHTASPMPGFTTSPSPSPTPYATATCPPVEIATPTPGVVIPSPTASATPTPGPYQSALDVTGASPEFAMLGERLAHEIATHQALAGNIDVAVAVTDLQTGELIAVNGDVLHRSGCTINMFALFAVVGEFESGRADPSRVAASIRAGIGSSYPPAVAQFLEAVFGSRDAGVERAQEMMRAWGMEVSVFDHVPLFGDGSQDNLLTAREANLALALLYRGEIFSPEWTEYTLARLRDIDANLNYILPAELPPAATVVHKIGYHWDRDGWVVNDIGIITFTGSDGQEKAYVTSYLSQKASTEYAGYSFGARLSRIVWEYFHAKYRPEG